MRKIYMLLMSVLLVAGLCIVPAQVTEASVVDNYIVDENFDAREIGTMSHQISGDYWVGKWGLSYNHGQGVVAEKATGDNWLELTPSVSGATYYYDSPWNINIAEEKQLALGSEVTEDKYLVFEIDLKVAGDDALQGDVAIRIGGDGNYALTNFKLNGERMGRHIDSTIVTGLREDQKNAYTQGEVGSLKWVLDRETKKYTWFWNGVLVEQNINAQFGGEAQTPALKYIMITMPKQTLAEGQDSVDTKLYIDNVKLYATDDNQMPTPEPTAEPTPAPTYNPMSADITFDNFELGHAYVRSLTGDYWTGGLDCGNWIAHGVVVSKKDTIDSSAAADDYCYEFKPDHTQTLNFRFTLDASRAYSMGEAVDTERYVVAEMDVAIGGEAYKTNGYGIFFGPGNNLSTTQLRLFNDKLGRIHTGSSGKYNEVAEYTAGEFAHLTWVLDREAKTYSYMLDGVVVERGVADLYKSATEFKQVHIRVYADAAAEGEDYIDSRLYLDNIKIYGVDENPVPTVAPTAEPTPAPTAEPTPAPTEAPVFEGTFINTGFEEFATGNMLHTLVGDYWKGGIGLSYCHSNGIVVSKQEAFDADAAANDYCLQFTPTTNLDERNYDIPFNMNVSDATLIPTLGVEGVEDRYVIVEMNVAVKGEDTKTNGYNIWVNSHDNIGILKLRLYDDSIVRQHNTSGADAFTESSRRAVTKGEMQHIKVVVDRETRAVTYFLNGELVEENIKALYTTSCKQVCGVRFQIFKETIEEGDTLDSKLYVDDVKMYLSNDNQMPTPAPTYNPMTFDNYQAGQEVAGTAGNGAQWTAAAAYAPAGVVVSKQEAGFKAAADDYCLAINAKDIELSKEGQYTFILDDTTTYAFDSAAEVATKNIVVEMDIAISGDKTSGFGIQIGNTQGNFGRTTVFMMKGDLIGSNWSNSWTSGMKQSTTMAKDQFVHLKYVVPNNLLNNNASWYLDGELITSVATTQAYIPVNPSAVWALRFCSIAETEAVADATMYIDNIQIYQEDAPAPTASPEPTPAPTAEPTAEPTPGPTADPLPAGYIMNESFNARPVGTMSHQVSGDYWTGKWGLSYNHNQGVVVAKEGADNWLELTPSVTGAANYYDSPWQINIAEEKWLALGSAVTEDKYLVFEVDLKVAGDDALQGEVLVRIAGDGNYALTNFKLNGERMGRHIDSTIVTGLREDQKNAYTQGEVGSLKWVLDRETKKYTWFWNGVLVEENINAQFGGEAQTPALKYILISMPKQTLAEGQDSVDTKLYIDNVKLYATDDNQIPTPAPTPDPTPAPTYTPYVIDTGYEEYALGTMAYKLSGDYWKSSWALSYHHNRATVIAKNTVFDGADADDYCIEMGVSTNLDVDANSGVSRQYDLPLHITLNEDRQFSMGSAVDKERYAVVELDVAINGEDTKTTGYQIRMTGNGNYAITNFQLNDDSLERFASSAVKSKVADYTKGEFAHLKWILDRETKTYAYFWNGEMIEAGITSQFSGEDQTPAFKYIRIAANKETLEEGATGIDTHLYIDNLKVYGTDEQIMPTPMPTPEPTPEPSAEPTPEPSAEPTTAPNPGIGEELTININAGDETAPATITAPEGGWVEGDNTFTVACAKACFVAVSYDGGASYTRLEATAASEGYSFTATNMTADTILAVGYVGDVNGDGTVSNSDATRLAAIFSQKASASNALMALTCDVNNDTDLTNSDITILRAAYAGKRTLNW